MDSRLVQEAFQLSGSAGLASTPSSSSEISCRELKFPKTNWTTSTMFLIQSIVTPPKLSDNQAGYDVFNTIVDQELFSL